MKDCGARKGIIVSGKPLQRGAQIVAKHEQIDSVILDLESTVTNYRMECRNHKSKGKHFALAFEENINVSDTLSA